MKSRDEQRWEHIHQAMAAEQSGRPMRLFASRRTLFGIPSSLDEELAKIDRSASGKPEKPMRRGAKEKTAKHEVSHPLAPVFDEHSQVLVLGTMPSPASREIGFYYGHPQNRFWKVMAALFDEPLPQDNDQRRALLLRHGVALWDVLAHCTIEGAKDGSIADCVPNDLRQVTTHAPIRAIFCTGAKATELYRRFSQAQTGIPAVRLPSTSPANAAVSLEALIEAYRPILDFCSDSGR